MIHSYPWYVADWRSSETRIRLAISERAIYRELLDYCWAEGSLPTEENLLAVICACDLREFRKCWKAVKHLFIEQDGRLTHHRVVEGRAKLQSWQESRKAAGKKGGLGRAIAQGKAEAIAKLTPKPSTSTSTSIPLPPPPPPAPARPSDFEPFADGEDPAKIVADAVEFAAAIWPKIGNKTYAKSAWEAEAARSTKGVAAWCERIVETAYEHAAAHRAALLADRRHFVPTLERWVANGDYTSPPPAVLVHGHGPRDLGDLDG